MREPDLRLGLIGDTIAASSAPRLHRLAGAAHGLEVAYDLLVPAELGLTFRDTFAAAAATRHGINVTYPYKELAAQLVDHPDPLTVSIGAVNTVLFGGTRPKGHNTDYTGFLALYRAAFGSASPGFVALFGAGGVGRAIGFALVRLGARAIRIADTTPQKARLLASDLSATGANAVVLGSPAEAAKGADGFINATPLGMVGRPGTPLEREHMSGASFAFDAVYTPIRTRFLIDAKGAGLRTISGYELFIHQGLDAWRLFSGRPVDETRLRHALRAGTPSAD